MALLGGWLRKTWIGLPERIVGSCHGLFTAWDSEIESLTSLNPSLIELDRRKRGADTE